MKPLNTIYCATFFLLFAVSTPSVAIKVEFDGKLIADACDVFPGDENVIVDFGTVVNKYLYSYGRTKSMPFQIRLINCDLTVGKDITLKFTGTESPIQKGLLAPDLSSTAKGIALGIENKQGVLIPINTGNYKQDLSAGNTTLEFQAYVQADPKVIPNKSLGLGDFTATTTFMLDYN
ncbi:fimbrial protein [Providencia sp. Me31A]|uniref:fimbrial protein n=1 Tax=Providencia sp. Me31A TaxID=3392637 RepID=UPI003D2E4FC8